MHRKRGFDLSPQAYRQKDTSSEHHCLELAQNTCSSVNIGGLSFFRSVFAYGVNHKFREESSRRIGISAKNGDLPLFCGFHTDTRRYHTEGRYHTSLLSVSLALCVHVDQLFELVQLSDIPMSKQLFDVVRLAVSCSYVSTPFM